MRFRYLIMIFLLTPWVSNANEMFSSQEEFSKWLTFYYMKPEPKKIPDAVRYMSESGLLNNKNAISPVFGFLAGVFKENPSKVGIWAQELKSIKPEHYVVVVLGVWYAKLPNSQKIVYGLLDSNDSLRDKISYLKQGSPIQITEIPLEQGPWVLDALWGEFSATGDAEPVSRIANALPWIDVKGDTNKLLVGGAANWSFRSNAIQHNRVFNIASELTKQHPENTHLLRALNDAKEQLMKRTSNQVNNLKH